MTLYKLHVLRMQFAGGGVAVTVAENREKMFNQLGGIGILNIETLGAEGTVEQFLRDSSLDTTDGESCG